MDAKTYMCLIFFHATFPNTNFYVPKTFRDFQISTFFWMTLFHINAIKLNLMYTISMPVSFLEHTVS